MAYSSLSFVTGEVLTSTKMNLLAANDASFHNGDGLPAVYDNLLKTVTLLGDIFTLANVSTYSSRSDTMTIPSSCAGYSPIGVVGVIAMEESGTVRPNIQIGGFKIQSYNSNNREVTVQACCHNGLANTTAVALRYTLLLAKNGSSGSSGLLDNVGG